MGKSSGKNNIIVLGQDIVNFNKQHIRWAEKKYKENDWRMIQIVTKQDPLIRIPQKYCFPYYQVVMKLITVQQMYTRRGVFQRYLNACSILKSIDPDLELIILDAWRSLLLQENLYWRYMRKFTIKAGPFRHIRSMLKRHFRKASPASIKAAFLELPEKLQRKLEKYNRRYVSLPAKNPSPSPHVTAGAIDVWLYKKGKPVDMGVLFDYMHEEAGAGYHLRSRRKLFFNKKGEPNDGLVCYYRNLMLYVMIRAGFSPYPEEFWHFNYGNQMHALVTGEPAIYGYIEPKKRTRTKKIIAPF